MSRSDRKADAFWVSTFLAAILLLTPARALADAGTVTGKWGFFQAQGNFCDTPIGTPGDKNSSGNQTCDSSSLYSEAEFNSNVGMPLMVLYVVNSLDNIVGTGVTDLAGNFSIGWNTPFTSLLRVRTRWEDGLGHFRVRTSTGGLWQSDSPPFSYCNGCGVNIGTIIFGNSGSPNGIANLYNGAAKMWYNALQYSSRMVNSFVNVEIRAFDSSGACPTGKAYGAENRICIPSTSADVSWQGPQARIAHEMGHIASYVENPRRLTHGQYCYPATTGSCGWTYSPPSKHFRGIALEEGRATFFGDVSFYWHGAADPRTCNSTGACPTSGRLETTITCSTKIGRTAQQVERYLWDTYDTRNDGTETNAAQYDTMVDSISAIPAGYAQGQTESPFVNSGTNVDCWDCFTAGEWSGNLLNYAGISTTPEYNQNCLNFWQ